MGGLWSELVVGVARIDGAVRVKSEKGLVEGVVTEVVVAGEVWLHEMVVVVVVVLLVSALLLEIEVVGRWPDGGLLVCWWL